MKDDWVVVSCKDFIDYRALGLQAILFILDWRLLLLLRSIAFYKKNKKYIFYGITGLLWLLGFR
jgi:hypothetical protein